MEFIIFGETYNYPIPRDKSSKLEQFIVILVSFGQGSSLLWTHMLRPFYSRPIVFIVILVFLSEMLNDAK